MEALERRFAAIGARVKVSGRSLLGRPQIDVGIDPWGEYFGLRFAGGAPVEVAGVDVWPEKQHLLLLVRDGGRRASSSAVATNATGSSQRFPSRSAV